MQKFFCHNDTGSVPVRGRVVRRLALFLVVAAFAALAFLVLSAGSTTAQEGSPPAQLPPVQDPTLVPDGGTVTDKGRTRATAEGASGLQAVQSDLVIGKSVVTGSGLPNIVSNGERLTYTLVITNVGTTPATNVTLYDTLPEGLTEIECSAGCHQVITREEFDSPLGGTLVVTATKEVTWSFSSLSSTPPNNVVKVQFSARVIGQSDGVVIRNTADLLYDNGLAVSNETATVVEVSVEDNGLASISQTPTWLSSDAGGTLGLDWGDFDGDGHLDLALGSTVGTSVYRFNPARQRLVLFWSNSRYSLGVRWVDVDGDQVLELVALGSSVGNSASTPGTNYVYKLAGQGFEEWNVFSSDFQLLRVEPGDFDGDGAVDLVVSTNAIDPPCPVLLYWNKLGKFDTADSGCVSDQATASLAAADFDNDGFLDLAIGKFPNEVQLLRNPQVYPATVEFLFEHDPGLLIDKSAEFLPYDFAWGDYDRDGYLDLAAAFPLDREARVYRNLGGSGFELVHRLTTRQFRTPLALDWADFNGDGLLDLFIADRPPKVVLNDSAQPWSREIPLLPDSVKGQVWTLAAADHDGDGDMDVALGNRDGASLLFTTFGSMLDSKITPVSSGGSSSVAWGEVDSAGYMSLFFGSGPDRTSKSGLYANRLGEYALSNDLQDTRFGPNRIALGDVDRDNRLDVALAAPKWHDRIYRAADRPALGDWHYWVELPTLSNVLAWGDVEGDRDLDLLAGLNGANVLYLNRGTSLDLEPFWSSAETDDTRSVAWGDYDGDGYLDFAAGNYNGPLRIYRNTGALSFELAWSAPLASATTSVAWGDYDGDGDLDLAVGNYQQANQVFENQNGDFAEVWKSVHVDGTPVLSKTLSVSWGDWDNDGDLDLAVGNYGEADQVYANQGSRPGAARLLWLWSSTERYQTAAVAWGDRDQDGDLELAISQEGNGWNGYYENHLAEPSHLTRTLLLPINPTYLAVAQPGTTGAADLYASPHLLSGPKLPTVTIDYILYDADGTWDASKTDAETRPVLDTLYEYSLDGGGTWSTATPAAIAADAIITPTRLGQPATFLWDAVTDQAISDNARFRVTVVHNDPHGPLQRALASAASLPFRVRATTCVWPVGPSIRMTPLFPESGDEITLEGAVAEGEGALTFAWDFGDGGTATGQVVRHTYRSGEQYRIKLTVSSEPCPVVGVVSTSRDLHIEGGRVIYLPVVSRNQAPVSSNAILASPAPTSAPSTTMSVELTPSPNPHAAEGPLQAQVLARPPAPRPPSLTRSPSLSAGIVPEAAIQSGSVFPSGVSTSTSTAVNKITASLKGIHSQPSMSGDGKTVAFWSTGSADRLTPYYPVFTEIDPGDPDWIELYNPTSGPINMTGWKFEARRGTSVLTYVFPSFTLNAGSYLLLREGAGTNTEDTLYMGIGIGYWLNGYPGSASLWNAAGQGRDFVRWGDSTDPPPTGVTWITPNPVSPPYGQNLARGDVETDSNAGLDWCVQAKTPLAANAGCTYDPKGNIEILMAQGFYQEVPTYTQATFSTGNILGGFNFWPSINYDGSRIAFFSDRDLVGQNSDESFEIFLYEPASNKFTQLTDSVGTASVWPSICAAGNRVVFASDANPVGKNRDGNREIFLWDEGLGTIRQLTEYSVGFADQPVISSAGGHVAYVYYDAAGNSQLRLRNLATDVDRTLVATGTNLDPAINHNGTRLAFSSRRNLEAGQNPDGNQEIFYVDIEPDGSLRFHQVTSSLGPKVNDQPALSADGNRIVFASDSEIWLYDVLSRGAVLLSETGSSLSRPTISNNGQSVAFAADQEIHWLGLAELVATKTAEPPQAVVAGEKITYTLVFANQGGTDAAEAGIEDRVPTHVLSPTWTCEALVAPSCTPPVAGTHDLTQTVNLVKGEVITFIVTGKVDPEATGTLVNTARVIPKNKVDDQILSNNAMTVTTTIVQETDLAIGKKRVGSGAGGPAVAGTEVAYTLAFTNTGPSWAHDLVITDQLPAGLEPLTSTPSYQRSGQVLTWTWASPLGVNASGRITYTALVAPWVVNPLTNRAEISSSGSDLYPGNNWAEETVLVTTSADLVVTKTAAVDPVIAGQPLTYTLAFENLGPSDAQNVSITDKLPLQALWDGTGSQADLPFTGPVPGGARGEWVWQAPTLPAGATGAITFSVTVNKLLTAPITLVNTATITSTTPDPVLENSDVVSTSVQVLIPVDLAVSKVGAPESPSRKIPIVYTIAVTNLSVVYVPGVVVYDDLPSQLQTASWTCTTSSPASTCTASGSSDPISETVDLAAGDAITFVVTGTLRSDATGVLVNSVTATEPLGYVDTDLSNNSMTITNTLVPLVDLAASKTVDRARPNAGESIVYTLVVSNTAGPNVATGVVVYDSLPNNVTWQADDGGGAYNRNNGRWSVGTLAVASNATLHITATVDLGTAGDTIENCITQITSDADDMDDTNDSSCAAFTVNRPPVANNATFAIDENSPNNTPVGTVAATDPDTDTLTYAITAGNTGGAFAIDAATGEIAVADTALLDYETNSQFVLTVRVEDGFGLFATATVTINVTDVNEPPALDDASFDIDENSPNDSIVGTLTAADVDSGELMSWAITAGNDQGVFAIRSTGVFTGEIYVLDNANLDYEAYPSFSLTVMVTDKGGLTDTATVTITVNDVNDAPVIADQARSVAENSAVGTNVGAPLVATDQDVGDTLTFSITAGNDGGTFAVNAGSGQITVADNTLLDYETHPVLTMTVMVTDLGGLTATATVTIDVTDVNEAPTITPGQSFTVVENSANGTVVGTVQASDPENAALTFSITAGNTNTAFAIGASSGQITVNKKNEMDYETTPVYTLTIQVRDPGNLTDSETVTIHVIDINDAPVIADQTRSVAENSAVGTNVGAALTASDPDKDTLTFSITAGNTGGTFAVNAGSGQITVADNTLLDHETYPVFTLTVMVSDPAGLTDTATVTINVTNVNEPPTITPGQSFTVDENSNNGTVVGTVAASDPENTALTFSIIAGNTGTTFAINTSSGQITVANKNNLDYETTPVYTLTIRVRDPGNLTDSETVTIHVNDVNEAPVINNQTRSIAENSAVGTNVGAALTASDPDAGDTLTFSITAGNDGGTFAIDAGSGQITVADNTLLDYETNTSFALTVSVVDGGGLSDTATVTINVTNVNDAPVIADQTRSVAENSAVGTNVGAPLVATDQDAGDTLTFSITAGNDGGTFAINASSGQITVADNTLLDYETYPVLTMTVMVSDLSGLTATATVTINVTDVNEAPTITPGQSFTVVENSANGTVVGTVEANDPDVGDTLTFSITAGNTRTAFAIGANSGEITVNKKNEIDYETTPVYTLTIQVRDPGNLTDSETVTIYVDDGNDAPVIADQTRSVAENSAVGTNVGAALTASDPDAGDTLTFSITAGNDGGTFAIDAYSGQITVAISNTLDYETTPAYTLTVMVTDTGGLTATATVTIDVNDVNEPPAITPGQSFNVDDGSANGTVVGTVAASDPEVDTLTFSITAGNDGGTFAIDAGSGQITVADNTLLDYETHPVLTMTVMVADTEGLTDTTTVTITVNDVNEPPTITPGQSFTVAENSANGTPVGTVAASDPDAGDTLTFSITAGNTGSTFAIGANSGEITVAISNTLDYETTPVYTLTVMVADTEGLTDTTTVTINVNDVNEPPTITPGQSFTVDENSANGTVVGTVAASDPEADTLTFSITAGNTGSTFAIGANSGQITVAISNTLDYETTPGYTLTVEVTDPGSLTGAEMVMITVQDVVSETTLAPIQLRFPGWVETEGFLVLEPELRLEKTVEPEGQVDPGDVLTYTLSFRNDGLVVAHQVVLTDLLDSLLISPTVVFTAPQVLSARPGVTYVWDLADLEPGDSGQIVFRGVVSPTTGPAVIVNEAILGSPTSRDLVSVTTGIFVPDLYVSKEGPEQPVSWGETITYTIAWGNKGRVAAPNAILSDIFPPGVVYVSDSSGWTQTIPTTGTVVWQVMPNPVPTNTHGSFVVTATVQPDVAMGTPLVNRVRIQSDLLDGNPLDSVWYEATDLRLPDLAVDKTGPLTVTAWSVLTYTIQYWNEGDQVASGVVITDLLPAGVYYLGDDSGLAHSEPVTGTHVWQMPADLNPGEGGSFEIQARVGSFGLTGSELANLVMIHGDMPERSLANNEVPWFSAVEQRYLTFLPVIHKP